jgi:hypothetical protein
MANSEVGVTIVKSFAYRGLLEEYSNQYWFNGATPGSDTAWKALADAIIAAEKAALTSSVTYMRAYAYDEPPTPAGDPTTFPPNVWSWDYYNAGSPPLGTLTTTGGIQMPGDVSAWLRWKTGRRTDPGGKPIYLRKYFHPVYVTSGTTDTLLPAMKTAFETFGAAMVTGLISGAYKLVDKYHSDDVLTLPKASTYVTTRSLKRRGKRPNPS